MSISSRDYSSKDPNKEIQSIESHKDRLSNLPDDVISSILSRLPTKYAVRTCVLSKKWEFKWISVYNIDIDDNKDRGESSMSRTWECKWISTYRSDNSKSSFNTFMERILNDIRRIRSFRLSSYLKNDCYHLPTWISSVLTSHRLESLEIRVGGIDDKKIVLPQCLFSCTSLTELKLLLNCTLQIPPQCACYSRLKNLCISNGDNLGFVEMLNVQSLSDILMLDFPVLQELELYSCKWLNVKFVEVRAPALLRFKTSPMREQIHGNDCVIKISADNLAEFESSGFGLIDNIVLSSDSVTFAAVEHYIHNQSLGLRASIVLKAIPCLKYLKISGHIVKVLIQANPGFVLPIFSQLKNLEICGRSCDGKEWLEFLEIVPNLEYLNLTVGGRHSYDFKQVEYWPPCLVSRLKEVKINNFCGKRDQVDLAKLILKNSAKLEKLILVFRDIKPFMFAIVKLDLSIHLLLRQLWFPETHMKCSLLTT